MRVRWFLALLALTVCPAVSFATVTEPWSVTIVGGPWDGVMGSGSFSYDETELIAGDEAFTPDFGSLEIEMTILGQAFTELDDVDYSFYPELGFFDYSPAYINFVVSEGGDNPVEIDEPDVSAIILIGEFIPAAVGGFESTGSIIIPEPAGLLLLSLAGLAGIGGRVRG